MKPSPVANVISQHAEESSFLWLLRAAAVGAPHYSLKDLAKLDNRVEAHLDGLRIAGAAGWDLIKDELGWKEPGEFFTAALLAFESGDKGRIKVVLDALAKAPEGAPGVVSALGWLAYERAAPHIRDLVASPAPLLRRIGIAAAAVHRRDPGQVLVKALGDADALLRARALIAVGELGRIDLIQMARADLRHEHPEVRFAAAWTVARFAEDASALKMLREIAESVSLRADEALRIAGRRMTPVAAKDWQARLASKPLTALLAARLTGVIGDPELIPWLIRQMSLPLLARAAGEAFSNITGVDLAYQDLEKKRPAGFESGPTEDPKDDDVAMDPDDNLPWPDEVLVAKWWEKHKGEFPAGVRHLAGKPISAETLPDILRHSRQRVRAAAALEMALIQPAQPLFEVRAPGFRQLSESAS